MYNRWASTWSPSIRATAIRGCARNSAWTRKPACWCSPGAVRGKRTCRYCSTPSSASATAITCCWWVPTCRPGYRATPAWSTISATAAKSPACWRAATRCCTPVTRRPSASLEAMASGIPVVAVRAGALAEIVPERCGVLCAPNNGDAMACAVRELFSHDVELRGQRARRHVERQHAWDAVVAGLLLHYHAVLGDSEARFPRYG
ncbi:glycosyltransferase [Pseudomonas aeruginosa]|uniref:glycosyltransferase n=1 Tax=Pseudomonas aeruginosa TaxID=287 RepID=UPI003432B2BE